MKRWPLWEYGNGHAFRDEYRSNIFRNQVLIRNGWISNSYLNEGAHSYLQWRVQNIMKILRVYLHYSCLYEKLFNSSKIPFVDAPLPKHTVDSRDKIAAKLQFWTNFNFMQFGNNSIQEDYVLNKNRVGEWSRRSCKVAIIRQWIFSMCKDFYISLNEAAKAGHKGRGNFSANVFSFDLVKLAGTSYSFVYHETKISFSNCLIINMEFARKCHITSHVIKTFPRIDTFL